MAGALRSNQGTLQMYKNKKWKLYTFKVTGSTYLHYFKKNLTKPKEEVLLMNVKSVTVPASPPKGGKFVFEVNLTGKKTWTLSADNNEECYKWMEAISPGSTKASLLQEEKEKQLFSNHAYIDRVNETDANFYYLQQQQASRYKVTRSLSEQFAQSSSMLSESMKRSLTMSLPAQSVPLKLSPYETPDEDGYVIMNAGQQDLIMEEKQAGVLDLKAKNLSSPGGSQKQNYYTQTGSPLKNNGFTESHEDVMGQVWKDKETQEDQHKGVAIDYVIQSSTITNLHLIGKGNFGEVFRADYRPSKSSRVIEVAVKTLKGDSTHSNMFAREEMLKEFSVMANMVHPNIVRLYGVVMEDNTNPWIVLEYFPHGDLKSYLIKCPEKSVGTLIKYMIDIAMGMHYIAQKGLIHRDLAARNVLVGEGEICKVADFGLIRELPSDMSIYYSQSILPLPIRWMPPEAITDKLFSEASDVWSYGILQWELFNPNLPPYKGMSNHQVLLYIIEGNRLPMPGQCPPEVAELMKSCWNKDPNMRPSFMHISSLLSTKISPLYM